MSDAQVEGRAFPEKQFTLIRHRDDEQQLALEVWEYRQRRCGNCRYYGEARGETDNDGECNNPTIGFLGGVFIPSTWGCADFTAKED